MGTPPTPCTGTWQFATAPNTSGDRYDAVLAANGTWHLFYERYDSPQDDNIVYVRSDALDQVETIAPRRDAYDQTVAPVVSADGTPSVFINQSEDYKILEFTRGAAGWASAPILDTSATASDGPDEIKAVLDGSGHAHLVLRYRSALQVWTDAHGAATLTPLPGTATPGPVQPFARVTANGVMHILYQGSDGAYDDGSDASGNWQASALPIPTPSLVVSIGVDSAGQPHALWTPVDTNTAQYTTLHHVWQSNGAWQDEVVPTPLNSSAFDGALDRDGHVHVAVYDTAMDGTATMTWATNASGQWMSTNIDIPGAQWGYLVRIGLDDAAKPHFMIVWRVVGDAQTSHLHFTFVQGC